MVIGRAVVYSARAAHSFSAVIKSMHCNLADTNMMQNTREITEALSYGYSSYTKYTNLNRVLPAAIFFYLANTKWCKTPEKLLKPRHMGTHMRVLSESFLTNTNTTGLRWFTKKRKWPQHQVMVNPVPLKVHTLSEKSLDNSTEIVDAERCMEKDLWTQQKKYFWGKHFIFLCYQSISICFGSWFTTYANGLRNTYLVKT